MTAPCSLPHAIRVTAYTIATSHTQPGIARSNRYSTTKAASAVIVDMGTLKRIRDCHAPTWDRPSSGHGLGPSSRKNQYGSAEGKN